MKQIIIYDDLDDKTIDNLCHSIIPIVKDADKGKIIQFSIEVND